MLVYNKDNFAYKVLSYRQAQDVFMYNLFDLFILDKDNNGTLATRVSDILLAIEEKEQIAIEVGHISIKQL